MRGPLRRPVRDGSQRVARPASSILGPTLLAEWDARFGVNTGASTWTDRIGARVLTGVNTPAFNVDGGNFKGLQTWGMAAASTQYFDTGGAGATLIAAGSSGLYCSIVARATSTADTGALQGYVQLFDNAAGTINLQSYRVSGAPHVWNAFMCGGTAVATAPAADVAVHLFELYLDATGKLQYDVDGVALADNPTTGVVTTAAIQRVSVGAFAGGVAPCNYRIARLRVCSIVPTTAQRAQLRSLDRAAWGVP